MDNRNRTENIGIAFENGIAKDWAFDVPDAFRSSLDITYMQRADKEANAALKAELGRPLKAHEKTWRMVWTRGDPPSYSFQDGDVFYDPPGVRAMDWSKALEVLCRVVSILRANPDPFALQHQISEEDEPAPEDQEKQEIASAGRGSGWVKYRVFYYEAGQIARQESGDLRQSDFAEFLRTGIIADPMPSPDERQSLIDTYSSPATDSGAA